MRDSISRTPSRSGGCSAASCLLGGIEHYKECRTERVTFGERNGLSFGTGFSATYIATQNLGVRFMTDYDCAPPVVRGSRERLHKLSFSLGVSAVF